MGNSEEQKTEKAIEIVKKEKRLEPLTKVIVKESSKHPWWALKNSAGKKDVSMTLMIISFVFCLGMAILGSFESINLGERSFSFRAFDVGFASTVLIPMLALYFGRRYTTAHERVSKVNLQKTEEDKEEGLTE